MPLDAELDPHFEEAARLNNLDPNLLRALALGESSGNPSATSEVGAGGLMQIMPDTARLYGIDDPYDPTQAIYGGAKILNDALTNAERLKANGRNIVPVDYALKTYFAGPEGPSWGPLTAKYPSRIAKHYQTLASQNDTGQQDSAQPPDTVADTVNGMGQPYVPPSQLVSNTQPVGVTNSIGEQYQRTPEGGFRPAGPMVTLDQLPSALAGVRPGTPAYAATRGPGNDVGINTDPSTGRQLANPPPIPTPPVIPSGIAQLAQAGQSPPIPTPPDIPKSNGVEQLAQVGQPQQGTPAAAQDISQLSDDALLDAFAKGSLPLPSAQGQRAATPPAVQSSPQVSPPQIGAEDIARAQAYAARAAALGETVPAWIAEIAKLPAVAPNAQAEASGKAAGGLPYVAPETAAKESETIRISRSGAITKGGVYIGHIPLETSVVDPATGAKYPAFTPPMGSAAGQDAQSSSGQPSGGLTGLPPGAVMSAPSELGPGQREALVARAKEEQEGRQKTIDAGSAAQLQQATLQNMKNDAPNFYTGPFAAHVQQANSILRLIDPSYTGQVASYEDFTKNAGALTRQAVHDTSPRAAVQEFNLIGAALPNPEISPVGLNRVINEYMGLNDYRIAKTQAQQMHEGRNGGPGNVTGFETNWQANVSPYAFIVARMEPADRQALFSQVAAQKGGPEQLTHLGQQIQYITRSGLDKFIR